MSLYTPCEDFPLSLSSQPSLPLNKQSDVRDSLVTFTKLKHITSKRLIFATIYLIFSYNGQGFDVHHSGSRKEGGGLVGPCSEDIRTRLHCVKLMRVCSDVKLVRIFTLKLNLYVKIILKIHF